MGTCRHRTRCDPERGEEPDGWGCPRDKSPTAADCPPASVRLGRVTRKRVWRAYAHSGREVADDGVREARSRRGAIPIVGLLEGDRERRRCEFGPSEQGSSWHASVPFGAHAHSEELSYPAAQPGGSAAG